MRVIDKDRAKRMSEQTEQGEKNNKHKTQHNTSSERADFISHDNTLPAMFVCGIIFGMPMLSTKSSLYFCHFTNVQKQEEKSLFIVGCKCDTRSNGRI